MTPLLYVTADKIGGPGGGATVTYHESQAMKELDLCWVLGRDQLTEVNHPCRPDPWCWDDRAFWEIRVRGLKPKLAHFYAGTFSDTIKQLQELGCRTSYTCAAHRVSDSKKAHEDLGIPYHYTHLIDPEQWKQYLQGYLDADLMICPSTHSAQVKREYGRTKPIAIIPHGCHLPENPKPLPKTPFTVGYLGAYGPDKGVRYLLAAWKKLNYPDAKLVLGGRDSQSDWVTWLIKNFGGGTIERVGWLDNVSDFYENIHCYVQPSQTEGFGIEVLESMAHSRPVLCSNGAGACDLVPNSYCFDYHDTDELSTKIDLLKEITANQTGYSSWLYSWQCIATNYTWDKVRSLHKTAWKILLEDKV